MTKKEWRGEIDEKNETVYFTTLPENVTNIEVGEGVETLLRLLFRKKTKAVVIQIFPNHHSIGCKPFTRLDVNRKARIDREGWTEVNTSLKDECKDDWEDHYAFMIAETLVDIWNKFMVTEFVAKIDEKDPYSIMIGWDKFMNEKQGKQYWHTHTVDGYNPNAPFWTREWLRDEHKQTTTGGGKV